MSSASSFSQSSKTGYATSLIASTIGSWDDEEQDYDEKSTKKVLDIMNQMDNILYQDDKQDNDNKELSMECLEWKNSFPHLRVRATQIIPSKETPSYHIIQRNEARSASPYFYIPQSPIDQRDDLSVAGFALPQAFQPVKDTADLESKALDDNYMDEQIYSDLRWEDEQVQDIVASLKSNHLSWAIFHIIEEESINDRSSTPTQDRPNQETKSDHIKQYSVSHIYSSKENSNFANAFLDAYEKEPCVFGIENCLDTFGSRYLVLHTIHKKQKLYNLNNYDLAAKFQGISIFHHEHASKTRFSPSVASLYAYHIHITSQGIFDEYFALDKRNSTSPCQENSKDTHNNPGHSIKEDLIHSIFDDLWAEIFPNFQGVVSKLTDDLKTSKTLSFSAAAEKSIIDEESDFEEDEIPAIDLLSAITIKPIPLQKRDVSNSKRVIETPQSPEPGYYLYAASEARPSSAKPNLGLSGRPSRPTSAKPNECYGSRLQTPLKFAAARQVFRTHHRLLPISSSNTANNSGSHGLKEAMQVTSMIKLNSNWEPRPVTSSHLSKRLPPLRGIVASAATAFEANYQESIPKIQRHVAFEQASPNEPALLLKRESSPRPCSASRRPITGNPRSRSVHCRPHTAVNESLSKLKSIYNGGKSPMHLNGTAYGKASQRSFK